MNQDSAVVTIKGVMPTSNGCAIFLGNEEKTFVIYVDPAIGNAVNMTLNKVKKERPLTHDLIGLILKGLETKILWLENFINSRNAILVVNWGDIKILIGETNFRF